MKKAVWLTLVLALWAPRLASAQVVAVGTITATGDVVVVPLTGSASAMVQLSVSSGGEGSYAFDFTVDGGTLWWPLLVTNQSDGSDVTTVGGTGAFIVQNAGFTAARVRAVSVTSGTVTVTATRGFGVGPVKPIKALDQNGVVRPVVTGGGLAPTLPLPSCNALTRAAGRCRP